MGLTVKQEAGQAINQAMHPPAAQRASQTASLRAVQPADQTANRSLGQVITQALSHLLNSFRAETKITLSPTDSGSSEVAQRGPHGFMGVVLLLLFAVNFAACNRQTEQRSQIKLQFTQNGSVKTTANKTGKVTTQSIPVGFVAAHLIVNVHFDGQLASFEWDCALLHDDSADPSLCAFPPATDFGGRLFPYGSGRTIQVLLVYGNEEGQLIFAYADRAGQPFNAPSVNISVGDTGWDFQGGGKQGDVSGRHASLLTGDVIGTFSPTDPSRPNMQLFDEEMFAGWFEFMFFEGVKMNYLHRASGGQLTPLFTDVDLVTLKSQISATTAVAVVESPSFYSTYPHGGSGFDSHFSEAESFVFGFFTAAGTPVANGSTASLSLPTTTEALYAAGTESAYRSLDSVGKLVNPIDSASQSWTDPVTGSYDGTNVEGDWVSASYGVSWLAGIVAVGSNSQDVIQVGGMSVANPTACGAVSDSDLVVPQCIKIKPQLILEGGLMPFEGPFEVLYNAGDNRFNSLETITDSGQTKVKWRYLPGVDNVAVHGASIFLVNKMDERNLHEDVPCNEWAYGSALSPFPPEPYTGGPIPPPATFAMDVAATGLGEYTADLAAQNTTDQIAVVCAYQNVNGARNYFAEAVMNYGFDMGPDPNCCGASGPATALSIEVLGGYGTINRDACIPVVITGLDDSGMEASPTTDLVLDLTHAGLSGDFYPEGNFACDQATISQVDFKMYDRRKILFFKLYVSGESGSIAVADSNAPPVLTADSQAISNTGINTATLGAGSGIVILTQSTHSIHGCEPVSYLSVDPSGNPAPLSTGANIYLDDSFASGYFYASEMDCRKEISSVNFLSLNPPEIFKTVFYRNRIVGTGETTSLRAHDGGVTNVYNSLPIAFANPGVPASTFSYIHHVSGTPPGEPFRTGFCYPMEINLKDDNFNLSPTTTLISGISVTADGGALVATMSDCSDGASSQTGITISAGDTSNLTSYVYIMPITPSYTLSVSVPGFNPENFGGPMANPTQLAYMGITSLNPSMCNPIQIELHDDVGSPISSIGYKNYGTVLSYTWVDDSASGSYISTDFSGCMPDSGPNYIDPAAFYAIETTDVGISASTTDTGSLTISAPGMLSIIVNFLW